jgi:hypothetical protein
MNFKDLEILSSFFYNITKISQDSLDAKETSKISGPVTINVASINTAISKLNSAVPKIDPNNTFARSAINKLVSYLMWFRTVGVGAESNMTGKTPPSVEEFKQIIKTNLFEEDFIMSIAALLQMSYNSTQLKNEFNNLK